MTRMLTIILPFLMLLCLPAAAGPSPKPASAKPAAVQPGDTQPSDPLPAAISRVSPTFCGYSSAVADRLALVDLAHWSGWIRQLSGADPVTVGGQSYTITTRYSPILFGEIPPYSRSMAFDYVHEQVTGLYEAYPNVQIEVDAYGIYSPTWKNLVLTIPGTLYPDQVVILSAHLDSISSDRYANAPGADDNATGAATLLEAARVLPGRNLPRTVRLIWFTGEEQGLYGSAAYVQDHDLSGIVGVINLDMFGYDNDNDPCFELHAGTLPASGLIASCIVDAVSAYGMDVHPAILTTNATSSSDHSSFWKYGIGAVEVLENYYRGDPQGCPGNDWSPYYHTVADIFDNLSLPYSYDIARAALASAFSLANGVPKNPIYFPLLTSCPSSDCPAVPAGQSR